MKIVILSAFYPYRGGIAQFNGALFRALEKKHEISAVTFKKMYPDFLFPGASQYVNETDIADKISAERLLNSINPFSWRATYKYIQNLHPDLLLTDIWMPFFGPSLGYVAGKCRKNNIVSIGLLSNVIPHEHKPGDTMLTNYYLNRHDGFVVLAESVKQDLLSLKSDAVFIKHPHPNYEHFGEKLDKNVAMEKLNIPKNKKVILFFGLIRKYKGLDILIEAMPGMSDEYFLLIAGEVYGDDKYYRDLIKKNNLEDRTVFIDKYLNDNEVSPLFSAADVCVLPYRSATQSGIVGIAYHFGVPVITTDVGGLREMVEPFGTGIVVDKPDVNDIRNAVNRYFDSNLRDELSKNISRFKEKYSWESLADSIVNLASEIKA
ncbi:MAG: glycosyltransferase [Bacteroidota bacterium]